MYYGLGFHQSISSHTQNQICILSETIRLLISSKKNPIRLLLRTSLKLIIKNKNKTKKLKDDVRRISPDLNDHIYQLSVLPLKIATKKKQYYTTTS